MKARTLHLVAFLFGIVLSQSVVAQMSTPPMTVAEKEKLYADAIEKRANEILKALQLSDAVKSTQVHDIIVVQYRTLRARDEAVDALLLVMGRTVNYSNRSVFLLGECRPLHDQFLSKLGAVLTPEQVVKVKDKMTYNKVQVTYDAYCAVFPDLKENEKPKIMEELKLAREEAIDGGSSPEKSEVFQKYKDRINAYLTTNGHDVAKAFKDWEAKQEVGQKATADVTKTGQPAK